MKASLGKQAIAWLLPVLALVFAAVASGELSSWFYYALAGVGVGILGGVFGPMLVNTLSKKHGWRKALLIVSVAGWLVLGTGLLVLNVAVERRVSWSIFPIVGLAMWPIGVWLYTVDDTKR